MRDIRKRRWLPALLLLTLAMMDAPGLQSQPPGSATTDNPGAQGAGDTADGEPSPMQVGDALMLHKRYQAAIEAYKKAPRDSAEAWNKMGIAYQLLRNLDDASHCYKTSLKLEPRNANVMNNLGTVYDSLKRPRAAEHMYRRALKVDPHSAALYKNLGTNLLAQRKFQKGWDIYKTALAIDPNIFASSANPQVEDGASLLERGAVNYFKAKGCVQAGLNDCAIEYLRISLNEGFTTPQKLRADKEFNGLHGTPAFEELLAAESTHNKS